MAQGPYDTAGGRVAHAEALAESDLCLKRQGEASSIFLTDAPSY